jgi:hypothetical protein
VQSIRLHGRKVAEVALEQQFHTAHYSEKVPVEERIADEEYLNAITKAAEEAASRGEAVSFVVNVFENQRWLPLSGFSEGFLLPTERGHMTHGDGTAPPSGSYPQSQGEMFSEGFGSPVMQPPNGWQWTAHWEVQIGENMDEEGWQYATMWGLEFTREAWSSDTVRRRNWTRLMEKAPPGVDVAYL